MATPTFPLAEDADRLSPVRTARPVAVTMRIAKDKSRDLRSVEEARPEDQGDITLRTSSFLYIGLLTTALVLVVAGASFWLGFLSSSFFRFDTPPPQTPAAPDATPVSSVPLEVNPDLRGRVDRLQAELADLRRRQGDLEVRLQSKTAEAAAHANVSDLLRAELVSREREIDSLSKRVSETRRRFHRGQTEYLPGRSAAQEILGFATEDGTGIELATPSADYPAELVIELTPSDALPGQPYRLSVRIHNRGNHSIALSGLDVVWNYGGRHTGGSVPFQSRRVPARSTLLLHEVDGVWVEELDTARITATVQLEEGGGLTNSLSWDAGSS